MTTNKVTATIKSSQGRNEGLPQKKPTFCERKRTRTRRVLNINAAFDCYGVFSHKRPSLFAVLLLAVSTIRGPENRGKPQITREKNSFSLI